MDIDLLKKIRHSPVRNYAVPGLTSWLIGEPGPNGCVRMFESERAHVEPIIPHSHRFDFHCTVLAGQVTNRLWTARPLADTGYALADGEDLYLKVPQKFVGAPHKYELHMHEGKRVAARMATTIYSQGKTYQMKAAEMHSIYFGRGAIVLFFEGPQVSDTSDILLPIANGEVVNTFKTEPWMFQRDAT